MLDERSNVAEFLGDLNLSVRHVGVEFGRRTENGVDFAVNLSNGAGEGGFVFGSIGKDFLEAAGDSDFTLFDAGRRYTYKLEKASENLAGMDAIEFAAGFSRIAVDETVLDVFRFGPAFYFGKQTRLQVNGEKESIAEIATQRFVRQIAV